MKREYEEERRAFLEREDKSRGKKMETATEEKAVSWEVGKFIKKREQKKINK